MTQAVLAGHALLVEDQFPDGDYPETYFKFSCRCGAEKSTIFTDQPRSPYQWFVEHCLTVLGAQVEPTRIEPTRHG